MPIQIPAVSRDRQQGERNRARRRAEAPRQSVGRSLLNGCYSAVQADALRDKVDCVVGMDGAIGEEAARAFAARFYGALLGRWAIAVSRPTAAIGGSSGRPR